MRTPAGVECRHYYEDFNRGRQIQECRLVKANRASLPWRPADCGGCAVPTILRANAGRPLRVELRIVKRWGFLRGRRIDAYCLKHEIEVPANEAGCPRCAAEERGEA